MRWRPIVGWEALYEVSDTGAVRSLDREIFVPGPNGEIGRRRYKGRVLRLNRLKSGYCMISMTAPERKRRCAYVHDLVTEAFIGPKPRGLEVCHNNGTRNDNRLVNLRYDTRSANAMDRHLHGTLPNIRGEECLSAKLTEEDVRWIRRTGTSISQRDMGCALGVGHTTVGNVLRGISWAHVR